MRRIEALDALRGLAALSVVVYHCLISFPDFFATLEHDPSAVPPTPYLIAHSPLHLLWAGHEAVILFFVLSGYVLTLPYVRGTPHSYPGYVIKRFFRIYVPYIIAIAISATLQASLAKHRVPELSTWFNTMWATPMTSRAALNCLLMTGRYLQNFDTSTWSLVHEMRISLIFPLLLLITLRLGVRWSVVAAFLVSVGSQLTPAFFHTPGMMKTIFDTAHFAAFFVVGILLAVNSDRLRAKLPTNSRASLAALLLGGAFCYTLQWYVPLARVNGDPGPTIVVDWAAGIGGSVFILFALHQDRIAKLLNLCVLRWLGKISYSLYLIHPVVLLTLVFTFHGAAPPTLIIACVPLASIAVAVVMYRVVEVPSIQLGRKLANALSSPRLIPVAEQA